MKKNLSNIFVRNLKGVLSKFPNHEHWQYAWLPAAAVFVALLPLTTTLGAGIKSLIDFFSRKEMPQETINSVDTKIKTLNERTIQPFIEHITSYHAKSSSSCKLIQMLKTGIPQEAKFVMEADIAKYKRSLQEDQLQRQISINSKPLDVYQENYIANLELDNTHQKRYQEYIKIKNNHSQIEQLSKQKRVIRTYLKAEHNFGKRLQHIICDYFNSLFKPVPTVVPAISMMLSTADEKSSGVGLQNKVNM